MTTVSLLESDWQTTHNEMVVFTRLANRFNKAEATPNIPGATT